MNFNVNHSFFEELSTILILLSTIIQEPTLLTNSAMGLKVFMTKAATHAIILIMLQCNASINLQISNQNPPIYE